MVANPERVQPVRASRRPRTARRNLVLKDMLAQNYISRPSTSTDNAAAAAHGSDLQQPEEPPAAPYFTSWLRPQILRAMGLEPGATCQQQQYAEYRAYYGGLKIKTTLDLRMQQAADQAIARSSRTGRASRRRRS